MDNPFESGHIKNYILLYSSIVVIMVLFFIASTLFNEVQNVEKKVFNTKIDESVGENGKKVMKNIVELNSSMFKLMPKSTINQ